MAYHRLSKWTQDAVEQLVELGISREIAERELQGVEWACVRDLAEVHQDDQLLLTFDKYGSAACATRYGVTDRTIRDWRQRALNRKAARRTASA